MMTKYHIEFIERQPLPQECQECKEIVECGGAVDMACYNCDFALKRFKMVRVPNEAQK